MSGIPKELFALVSLAQEEERGDEEALNNLCSVFLSQFEILSKSELAAIGNKQKEMKSEIDFLHTLTGLGGPPEDEITYATEEDCKP